MPAVILNNAPASVTRIHRTEGGLRIQKAGCGKTITAINLSAFLARERRRVLLVDMDPLGHATLGLLEDPRKNHGSRGFRGAPISSRSAAQVLKHLFAYGLPEIRPAGIERDTPMRPFATVVGATAFSKLRRNIESSVPLRVC